MAELTKVPETNPLYSYLSKNYPDQGPYYTEYYEGGYLDKSYVKMYNKDKKFLDYDPNHQGSYS